MRESYLKSNINLLHYVIMVKVRLQILFIIIYSVNNLIETSVTIFMKAACLILIIAYLIVMLNIII